MKYLNRPVVQADDGYLSKVIKYIPAEITAVYVFISGIISGGDQTGVQFAFSVTLISLMIITPVWIYVGVSNSDPLPPKQQRIYHAIIALLALIIWVYNISIDWTSQFFGIDANPTLGAIVLALFTLIVPILERLFIKPFQWPKSPLDSPAQDKIDACEAEFEAHKSDCSGFVKAVASQFGVALNGQADNIVDQINGSDWIHLNNGVEAKTKADAGWLVIAGLKSSDHNPPRNNGHVVVVVSGPLAHNKYPTGYWGTLGSIGKKNTTINYAWTTADRDNVVYRTKDV